jgi:hypothetical protein
MPSGIDRGDAGQAAEPGRGAAGQHKAAGLGCARGDDHPLAALGRTQQTGGAPGASVVVMVLMNTWYLKIRLTGYSLVGGRIVRSGCGRCEVSPLTCGLSAGLVLEFAAPVVGPLLLGQLSHFGFGMFEPDAAPGLAEPGLRRADPGPVPGMNGMN